MTYHQSGGNAGDTTRSVRFFGKPAAVEKTVGQD